MVDMTQGVNIPEREIIFLAELPQPVVGRIVVHRVSVSRNEKPVAFKPLCAELYAFFVLLRFVLFQNIKHKLRQLHRPLRAFCLCGVGVNACLYGVI